MSTFEIAYSAGHEAHNALHCLGSEEVVRHVVVCLNKSVYEHVKKKFSSHPELQNNERLHVLTLYRALNEEWS